MPGVLCTVRCLPWNCGFHLKRRHRPRDDSSCAWPGLFEAFDAQTDPRHVGVNLEGEGVHSMDFKVGKVAEGWPVRPEGWPVRPEGWPGWKAWILRWPVGCACVFLKNRPGGGDVGGDASALPVWCEQYGFPHANQKKRKQTTHRCIGGLSLYFLCAMNGFGSQEGVLTRNRNLLR